MENRRITLPKQRSLAQRKLQKRIWLYLSIIVSISIFMLLDMRGVFTVLGHVGHTGPLHSFRLVILFVIEIYYVIQIFRCRRGIQKDAEFFLITEQDERRILVNQKAGKAALTSTIIIFSLAAVLIGYINYLAFCVLLFAILFILVIWGVSWLIFNKKL